MKLTLLRSAALALACLFGAAAASAQTGYTTVSGSQLHDATGTLVTNSTIRFQPVNAQGVPVSFRAGGAGGQTIAYPVSTTVTAGAFSIVLADTTLTSPVNPCYSVSLISNLTGRAVPFPGYSCIQPSGSTWSFDTYIPGSVPLPLQLSGCSIAVGTVASLSTGATPTVTNSGSTCAAVLNFGIPLAPGGNGSYDAAGAAAAALSSAEGYSANASNLASGTVPAARLPAATSSALGAVILPTGTPSASTAWCGNYTWCAVGGAPPSGYGIPTDANGAWGTKLNMVPVEAYFATAGTSCAGAPDSTTAIQATVNSLASTGGQILLGVGYYRVSSPVLISTSGLGIKGQDSGVPTYNSIGSSVLCTTSPSIDVVDVWGPGTSNSSIINLGVFQDFAIQRTVVPTGTSSGIFFKNAGGITVSRMIVNDGGVYGYRFQNVQDLGLGGVFDSVATFGGLVTETSGTYAGFYLDSSTGLQNASFRMSHDHVATLSAVGATVVAGLVQGSAINDLFADTFKASGTNYGFYINYTGSGANDSNADIHLNNSVFDEMINEGFYINGLTAAGDAGGGVQINGGYVAGTQTGSQGIVINNSVGVSVQNVQLQNPAANVNVSGSSQISLVNLQLAKTAAAGVEVASSSNVSIIGGTYDGAGAASLISFAGTSYGSIVGPTMSGTATKGISLDASSTYNTVQGASFGTGIATQISNLGTNNQIGAAAASTTWPPSAAAPVFSPAAGAISSGATVTDSCSAGTPYISAGTTAVAGSTGIAVSSASTLYGSCQGSGYFSTASAAYTVSTVTYVNTAFNEASTGTNLAGTTPATCTNGCVGPWVLYNPTDWTYASTGASGTTGVDYINSGVTAATMRWTVASTSGNFHVFLRFSTSSPTNYVNVTMVPGTGITISNVVSGTSTTACQAPGSGTLVGNYTLVYSGTAITVTGPTGTCSGTIAGTALTGTDVGIISDAGPNVLSALSVKSN